MTTLRQWLARIPSWRTIKTRLSGKCQLCGEPCPCGPGHGSRYLDSYQSADAMDFWNEMVSCGRCVMEYGTALGSIRHSCTFDDQAGVKP